MKTFHNLKCKANPHEKPNSLKGVVNNRNIPLATREEIKTVLGEQEVTDYKIITIRRDREEIQTHIHFDI